jgi:Zn-dependent protease
MGEKNFFLPICVGDVMHNCKPCEISTIHFVKDELIFRVQIIPGILVVSFILVIEVVAPEKRVFVGMVSKIYASVGQLLVAGLGYWLRDWKYVIIASTVPLFLMLIGWFFLPESTRSVGDGW